MAAASTRLDLTSHDVHVWRAALDRSDEDVERLAADLSQDEQARARRFYFERDRRRFTVARATLRRVLARYLDVEPGRLAFQTATRGKPFVADPAGDLRFNVSHSRDLALIAVTRGREVGVDVEHIAPPPDLEQLASYTFSSHENAALKALPPEQRVIGFYNCWTRKEAFSKATGDGLYRPLKDFDVSLTPGEPARLLRLAGEPQAAARWSLVELAPAPGFVGALCVEGSDWALSCWKWEGVETRRASSPRRSWGT